MLPVLSHSYFKQVGDMNDALLLGTVQLILRNIGILGHLLKVFLQAYNLSKDHKPDLEVEKDRILKAGGFIQVGRVNGSLNLARAIGNKSSFY